jgi:hypothetical protein
MSENDEEIEIDDDALELAAGGGHTSSDFQIMKPVNTTVCP